MTKSLVVELWARKSGVVGIYRVTCVGQVEIDPFCRAVLAKHWPDVPRWEDVKDATGEAIRERCGRIDAVVGGFPCQDVSVAGKGAGIGGERSGLWNEMLRVIREIAPDWIVAENVPALRSRGADLVLGDLEGAGYTCWPLVVGAEHVGAPHRRHRVFIVAITERKSRGSEQQHEPRHEVGWKTSTQDEPVSVRSGDVADSTSGGLGVVRGSHGQGNCGDPDGSSAAVAYSCRDSLRQLEQRMPRGRPGGVRDQGEAEPARDGVGLANTSGGKRADSGSGRAQEGVGPAPFRWPAGPGQPQREWEEPRTLELSLGGSVDGLPVRLVRSANRNALRAYGNAVVPQVAEIVGRAILHVREP